MMTTEPIPTTEQPLPSELVDRFGSKVYSLGLRILREETEATALTKEVFQHLSQSIDQYDPERGSLKAWVMSLAHHKALARIRIKRGEASLVKEPLVAEGELQTVLDDRQVLERAYFDGYRVSQIATLTRMEAERVASAIHRGMTEVCRACETAELHPPTEDQEYAIHLEEIAAVYAVGALDKESDRNLLEDLVAAGDPFAVDTLRAMFEGLAGVAESVEQVPLPEAFEDDLQLVAAQPVVAARKRLGARKKGEKQNRYGIGIGAVTFILLCAMIGLYLSKASEARETRKMLTVAYEERDSLHAKGRYLAKLDSNLRIAVELISARGTEAVILRPTRDSSQNIHLFWSGAKRLAFLLDPQLPTTDSGITYRFWARTEKGDAVELGAVPVIKDNSPLVHVFQVPVDNPRGFVVTADSGRTGTLSSTPAYSGAVR
jgi:RNA polymerase sigma-70 factor, ECF subfamily